MKKRHRDANGKAIKPEQTRKYNNIRQRRKRRENFLRRIAELLIQEKNDE